MIRHRLQQFTDASGVNAVVFSDVNEEWEPTQELRAPRTSLVGADYAHDQLGASASIKGLAAEIARFEVVEASVADLNAAIDQLRNRCFRNARGKLWSVSGTDDRRWCWARVRSMPEIRLGHLNITWMPVTIVFDRLSDWYAEDVTETTQSISNSPALFSVTNSGNAPVRNAVIELRANGANGFQALTLESLSTGDTISSDRAAEGSGSRLRIDCGRHAVEYSNDGGDTWTTDWGNVSYGAEQIDFLRLDAGVNSLRYSQETGTPDLDIVVRFYATWD